MSLTPNLPRQLLCDGGCSARCVLNCMYNYYSDRHTALCALYVVKWNAGGCVGQGAGRTCFMQDWGIWVEMFPTYALSLSVGGLQLGMDWSWVGVRWSPLKTNHQPIWGKPCVTSMGTEEMGWSPVWHQCPGTGLDVQEKEQTWYIATNFITRRIMCL